jgi:hypothetical protein
LLATEYTWVYDVRRTEVHTAEPLGVEPNSFEIEIAIEKLKSYISQGIDQIQAELLQTGGNILRSEIHKLILFGINFEVICYCAYL